MRGTGVPRGKTARWRSLYDWSLRSLYDRSLRSLYDSKNHLGYPGLILGRSSTHCRFVDPLSSLVFTKCTALRGDHQQEESHVDARIDSRSPHGSCRRPGQRRGVHHPARRSGGFEPPGQSGRIGRRLAGNPVSRFAGALDQRDGAADASSYGPGYGFDDGFDYQVGTVTAG
jgi:hypothetical protein